METISETYTCTPNDAAIEHAGNWGLSLVYSSQLPMRKLVAASFR